LALRRTGQRQGQNQCRGKPEKPAHGPSLP
jgi:hypothetical protein